MRNGFSQFFSSPVFFIFVESNWDQKNGILFALSFSSYLVLSSLSHFLLLLKSSLKTKLMIDRVQGARKPYIDKGAGNI